MKLGRIPWINCYPVYAAIDRGLVSVPADLVSGTASELNDLLAAGELQVSVVSAVEYARNAAEYHLLPDLAITCDGPVHSVALFSRRPVAELDRRTILVTASSRTSVLLLDLLCRHRWGVRPHFASARAEAPDLDALEGLPHEAVLVIGDAALLLAAQAQYPVRVDLGEAWKEWTGLPFVFAVWARAATRGARRCGRCTAACWNRAPGAWSTSTSWRRRRIGGRVSPSMPAASISATSTTRSRIATSPGSPTSSGGWRRRGWSPTGRCRSSRRRRERE